MEIDVLGWGAGIECATGNFDRAAGLLARRIAQTLACDSRVKRVNYPMTEVRSLSPALPRSSVVSETYGLLTEARRPILIAAMWSARPENPQATHLKRD